MSIQKRINQLVKRKDEVNAVKLTSYILCKTFGWTYQELIEQPIPFVLDMIEMIRYDAEKQKEASEKGNKTDGMKRLSKKGQR